MSTPNSSKPDSITRTASESSGTRKVPATPPREPTRSSGSLAATQTVAAPASVSLVRTQWLVVGVMVAIALFAAARMWMIEGLSIIGGRVVRIDGPSMAPAFLGDHYRVTCEDCGFVWCCDAEDAPASREASCPNCGYQTNTLRDEDLVPGQAVLIDHWPIAARGLRTSEVVAAPDPAHPGGLVIKRVAAQPGERLAIRSGDLYVDGKLVRKSWLELAQVRILVHDNSFLPQKTTGVPDRWQDTAAAAASGAAARGAATWHAAPHGYRCLPAGQDQWNWLQYTHQQMFGWHSRTRQSPVLDLDSYNPSETRLLNSVPDVHLSCRLRNLGGTGQFALAGIDGDQRFEAVIDPRRQTAELVAIDPEGRRTVVARNPQLLLDIGRRGVVVEFGLCDQQVILRLAGRQIFRFPYERAAKRDTMHPLLIGSQGLALAIDELQVWRDNYYLAPDGTGNEWSMPAESAADWLALLGDNTSVSVDSRHWTTGVSPRAVRGVVLTPFWAR